MYRMLYYVKSSPEMRGDAIKDARGSIDRGGFSAGAAIVELEMNPQGRAHVRPRDGRERAENTLPSCSTAPYTRRR